jgi:molecular chaperone DnaK (HSP70)
MSYESIIGIDLGTTNSEVAVVQNGKVILLKVDGSKIIPSVVSLGADGQILVGVPAINNELANPQNTIRCIKRKIDQEEQILLGDRSYTPPMIASFILARLKLAAEDFLQAPVQKAVITVPAFFNEKQREATKEAAALAGLEAVRLLNEPTAAALAYSLGKKENELCLVYDLGGGTFDVSIVQQSPQIMEVKASHGDTELGGSDIDRLIAEKIKQNFLELHGIDLSLDSLSWIRLMRAAESAKIRLSNDASVEIVEEFIAQKDGVPLHLHYTLSRTDLEDIVRPLLERTLSSVRKALEMGEITAEQIDRVVLVGGAAYMPLVSQLLEQELQIAPQTWIDPTTVVARGAAIEAATIAGESLGPVMVDITPHSLGTSCLDSDFHVFNKILIRRNTPIPCTSSSVFYKTHPRQDVVKVDAYQGESADVSQNTLLGDFKLEGLADSPDSAILIKFHLDRSGLLHVAASDISTGKKVERVLKKAKNICEKDVDLTALESVRIYQAPTTQENSSNEEDWDEMPSLDEMVAVDSQQLFDKVENLLQREDLETADREEITHEFELAKAGDEEALKKLSDLVYYME